MWAHLGVLPVRMCFGVKLDASHPGWSGKTSTTVINCSNFKYSLHAVNWSWEESLECFDGNEVKVHIIGYFEFTFFPNQKKHKKVWICITKLTLSKINRRLSKTEVAALILRRWKSITSWSALVNLFPPFHFRQKPLWICATTPEDFV